MPISWRRYVPKRRRSSSRWWKKKPTKWRWRYWIDSLTHQLVCSINRHSVSQVRRKNSHFKTPNSFQSISLWSTASYPSAPTTPAKLVPKPSSNLTPYTQQRIQMSLQPQSRTPINARASPQQRPGNNPPMQTTPLIVTSPTIQQIQMQRRWQPPPQMTPYPIINQNAKNLFEKVVDYLIGEGPSSRYGMICKECHGHNGKFINGSWISSVLHLCNSRICRFAGMVSEEEYEYSAFKCAFCKTLNPAKKLRPVAPRLPVPSMPSGASAVEQSVLQRAAIAARAEEPSSSTSTSDKESSKCDYFLSFAKKQNHE